MVDFKNNELIGEVERCREDMTRQERQISDLKGELRKYEHHVDIITDQHHKSTQDFIGNLRSKHEVPEQQFASQNLCIFFLVFLII
jgi:hypothetical protein